LVRPQSEDLGGRGGGASVRAEPTCTLLFSRLSWRHDVDDEATDFSRMQV
jgi:hypothetical protein